MPAPTYSAGSPLLSAVSLAAGKNAAALIDLSTVIQGNVFVQMQTGASNAPSVGTSFYLRRVIGAKATGNTTLSPGPSSGATSISVVSANGITKGRMIALIAASTGIGEIVTVSAISGTTLTVSALENSYSTSDLVFLVEDTASGGTVVPGTSWTTNTSYDTTMYPPIGVWILHAVNGDASYAVTVTNITDTVPTIQ
jgi:hypothetical protein